MVVSGKALDVALGLLEQVGNHSLDIAMLEPRWVVVSSIIVWSVVGKRSIVKLSSNLTNGECLSMGEKHTCCFSKSSSKTYIAPSNVGS